MRRRQGFAPSGRVAAHRTTLTAVTVDGDAAAATGSDSRRTIRSEVPDIGHVVYGTPKGGVWAIEGRAQAHTARSDCWHLRTF